MIILKEQDFVDKPTPSLRAKLAPTAIEQGVRLLTAGKACAIFSATLPAGRLLWAVLNEAASPEKLQAMFVRTEETFDFGDPAHVTAWLHGRDIPRSEPIAISWHAEDAIATTWEHFVECWRCYRVAGSDDTLVIPLSESWQLQFHHEGALALGWRLR